MKSTSKTGRQLSIQFQKPVVGDSQLLKCFKNVLTCSMAFLTFCAAEATPKNATAASQDELFFVAGKKGIFAYRMNSSTGAVTNLGVAVEVSNPGFLALHPNRQFIYSVNAAKIEGKNVGVVSSFSIEPKTGKLTFINQQPTGGTGPTHLAVDRTGKNVLVANYGSGSISTFPIQENGSLNSVAAFIQHHGSSTNPQRQDGPHAHCITTDPANHFVLACDLGLDKILVYKFDSAKGSLSAHAPAFAPLKPGAGPRHHAFHPNGKFVYVINELDSTITTFSYDNGTLQERQTLSTLPKNFTGKNSGAEVAVHSSGKFVYGSNRGHDSIVVFSVNEKTRELTPVQHQSTQGKVPRHFEIDPSGNYLLAANQDSGTVVIFRIDPKTGRLNSIEQTIEVETPQCVKFVPLAKGPS